MRVTDHDLVPEPAPFARREGDFTPNPNPRHKRGVRVKHLRVKADLHAERMAGKEKDKARRKLVMEKRFSTKGLRQSDYKRAAKIHGAELASTLARVAHWRRTTHVGGTPSRAAAAANKWFAAPTAPKKPKAVKQLESVTEKDVTAALGRFKRLGEGGLPQSPLVAACIIEEKFRTSENRTLYNKLRAILLTQITPVDDAPGSSASHAAQRARQPLGLTTVEDMSSKARSTLLRNLRRREQRRAAPPVPAAPPAAPVAAAVVETALLEAGIEPNPGPDRKKGGAPTAAKATPPPRPIKGKVKTRKPTTPAEAAQAKEEARVAREVAAEKAHVISTALRKDESTRADKVKAALQEALAQDADKAAPAIDVVGEEEARAAAQAAAREKLFSKVASLRPYDTIMSRPMFARYVEVGKAHQHNPLAAFPVLQDSTYLSSDLSVGDDVRALPLCAFPYVVLRFDPQPGLIERDTDLRLPRNTKAPACNADLIKVFHVFKARREPDGAIEEFTPLMLDDTPFRLDLSLVQYSHLYQSRIVCAVPYATYANVSSMLASDRRDPTSSTLHSAGHLYDLLVTTLLTVLNGPRNYAPDSLFQVVEESAVRGILSAGARAQGGVTRAGISVHGYSFEASEMLQNLTVTTGARFKETLRGVTSLPSNLYCAVNNALHVEGLLPTFPCPFDIPNLKCGFLKRLAIGRLTATEVALTRASIITDQFEAFLRARQDEGIHDRSLGEVHALAVQHCRDKNFSADEEAKYMDGVNAALRGDVFDVKDFFAKSFIKPETYPLDELKAPRFIIAPEAYTKGYLYGLLINAEHRFFDCMRGRTVKGRALGQTDEEVRASLEGLGGYLVNSDYTSMESNINPQAILREGRILAACEPDPARAETIRRTFLALSTCDTVVSGALYSMILPPMRLSGTQQTSVGNYINNLVWSFSVLCDASGANPNTFFQDKLDDPWWFEGDDGLIWVPRRPDETALAAACRDMGVRLKIDIKTRYEDTAFCKARVAAHQGHATRLPEPLAKLSNLFCTFNMPNLSDKASAAYLYCKAFCLKLEAPLNPITSKVCDAVMKRFKDIGEPLLADVQFRLERRNPGVEPREDETAFHHIADLLYQELQRKGITVTESARQVVDRIYDIPQSIRTRFFELYGITPLTQCQIECEVEDECARGKTTLSLSRLRPIFTQYYAVARTEIMRTRDLHATYQGVRDRVATSRTVTGLTTYLTPMWASLKRWVGVVMMFLHVVAAIGLYTTPTFVPLFCLVAPGIFLSAVLIAALVGALAGGVGGSRTAVRMTLFVCYCLFACVVWFWMGYIFASVRSLYRRAYDLLVRLYNTRTTPGEILREAWDDLKRRTLRLGHRWFGSGEWEDIPAGGVGSTPPSPPRPC